MMNTAGMKAIGDFSAFPCVPCGFVFLVYFFLNLL